MSADPSQGAAAHDARGEAAPQGVSPGTMPSRPGAQGPASDPRVEDALSRLSELDGMPLGEQVAVFTDIHRRLDGVLADPESRG